MGVSMVLLMRLLNYLDTINEWVGKVLYPGMLLMCILIFWEVLMRYVFNRPTLWVSEATQLLFAICSLLAGGHIHRENSHISVDILSSRFSLKGRFIANLISFPFFLLFVGALVYFGSDFGIESLMKLERSDSAWSPPIYPFKLMVPLGALLLFLQGIANFIRVIVNYAKRVD
jgi:TRAP-type mannitol/chloroaromatic compound transport system permease small subunit